jgi:hypothetical protein
LLGDARWVYLRPCAVVGGVVALRYEFRRQKYHHVLRYSMDIPLNVYRKRKQATAALLLLRTTGKKLLPAVRAAVQVPVWRMFAAELPEFFFITSLALLSQWQIEKISLKLFKAKHG